jgi:hypothetical protein
MKKETILLSIFVFIACLVTIGTIYYSEEFKRKNADADSFGISPPYINAFNLQPGDTYKQSIRILRGDSDAEQTVTARFDDLSIVSWFTILPSEIIVIKKGEQYANFNFELKIPDDAYNGEYKGKLYFVISSNRSGSGVSLRLGARADVNVTIVGGQDVSSDLLENRLQNKLADNELAERLQGRFVMRTESRGQLYYLHPNTKSIFYLAEANDFLELIKNEARGISDELLSRIALDLSIMEGTDSDNDGLPDLWEESIGTDINLDDTDDDGFSDFDEMQNGFSPLAKDKLMNYNTDVSSSLAGFLLLQVENKGQIWYVNPNKNKRLLLANLDDSLPMIEEIALGISEENYQELLSH